MVRVIVLVLIIIGVSVLIGGFIFLKNQAKQETYPAVPVIPVASPTSIPLDYPNEEFIPPFTTP